MRFKAQWGVCAVGEEGEDEALLPAPQEQVHQVPERIAAEPRGVRERLSCRSQVATRLQVRKISGLPRIQRDGMNKRADLDCVCVQ